MEQPGSPGCPHQGQKHLVDDLDQDSLLDSGHAVGQVLVAQQVDRDGGHPWRQCARVGLAAGCGACQDGQPDPDTCVAELFA